MIKISKEKALLLHQIMAEGIALMLDGVSLFQQLGKIIGVEVFVDLLQQRCSFAGVTCTLDEHIKVIVFILAGHNRWSPFFLLK